MACVVSPTMGQLDRQAACQPQLTQPPHLLGLPPTAHLGGGANLLGGGTHRTLLLDSLAKQASACALNSSAPGGYPDKMSRRVPRVRHCSHTCGRAITRCNAPDDAACTAALSDESKCSPCPCNVSKPGMKCRIHSCHSMCKQPVLSHEGTATPQSNTPLNAAARAPVQTLSCGMPGSKQATGSAHCS